MQGPAGLTRFAAAQDSVYAEALAEVRAGKKTSHWMWFIFPQLDGLGSSAMARVYGIKNLEEARAYLSDPVLGPRLVEISEAALSVQGRSAREIFGSPDDMKLRSCATLFGAVSQPRSVFSRVIDRFFDGEEDARTVERLRMGAPGRLLR